jgi:hypothetical protein
MVSRTPKARSGYDLRIDVYLEVGRKRTFAAALEWPGWCRAARDEPTALQALMDYAPRYAAVVEGVSGFRPPAHVDDLMVRERLPGDASTEMGSLSGNAPTYDAQPVDALEHRRLADILVACWARLDQAVDRAEGKTLETGPRGGGRKLDAIFTHVLDGEGGYLRRLDYKRSPEAAADAAQSRAAMLDALGSAVRGEVPEFGPRGGRRWSARYFVRREAWHVLDHAWEIEDRSGRAGA